MPPRKGRKKATKASKETTPTNSPNSKSRLSDQERKDLLENLDIEVDDRLRKLRANLSVQITSIEIRGQMEMSRLPKAILSLRLDEFVEKFGGSVKTYLEASAAEKVKEYKAPEVPPPSAKKRKLEDDIDGTEPDAKRQKETKAKGRKAKAKTTTTRSRRTTRATKQSEIVAKDTAPPSTKKAMTDITNSPSGLSPLPASKLNPRLPPTPGSMSKYQTRRVRHNERLFSMNGSPLVNPVVNPIEIASPSVIKKLDTKARRELADRLASLQREISRLQVGQ